VTIDQARRLQAVSRWHRRIALVVVAWLVFLALTGLAVNHANGWGLDRARLAAPLQRLIYGIEPEVSSYCESFPQAGEECARVFASLELPFGRLLVADSSLLLLDGEGSLVERLPAAMTGLTTIDAALVNGDAVFLRGGDRVVRAGSDLVEFEPVANEVAIPAGSAWQARPESATGVSWERFLLDLHAARFLGPLATWFNDLMAVLILLLAASGAWLHRLKRGGNGR
jgi:hypothetical protein